MRCCIDAWQHKLWHPLLSQLPPPLAGVGGAAHVTTVDLAEPAIAFANINWEQHNGLEPSRHEGHAADCFDFLESARKAKERWDVVVVDPPSFAPNKESLERAKASYVRVFAAAAQVGGVYALGVAGAVAGWSFGGACLLGGCSGQCPMWCWW